MKKILLLTLVALVTYSSTFAIGSFKVVIKKPGAAVDVQVRIVDYGPTGPTTEFTGATVSLTPNASGIIVASVPETPAILATDVTSFYIVEVWAGSPLVLSSQQRLDEMIFEQAQTGLTDNEGNVTLEPGKELIFPEPSGSGTNFTSFKSPALAADVEYTLPVDDGSPNQYLKTDGSGVMSWSNPPTSPTGAAGGSLAGTYPNPTIAGGAITNVEISGTAAINASKLADGSVSNAELQQLGAIGSAAVGISDAQTLTNKTINTANNTITIAAGDVTSGTFANGRVSSSNVTQHEGAITIGNLTGAPTGAVVGISDAQTLTNKTINSDNNTITNIVNADIKATAAIAYSKLNLTNSIVEGDFTAKSVTAPKIDPDGATNGHVLTVSGTDAVWAAPSGGGGGGGATIQQATTTSISPLTGTYSSAGISFSLDANTTYMIRGDFQDVEIGGTSGRFDSRLNYTGTYTFVHLDGFVSSVIISESSTIEDLNQTADNTGTSPSFISGVFTTNTAGTLTLEFKETPGSPNQVGINAGGTITLIKM